MGSAEIACAALQTLLATDGIEIVGMVTQPDRPAGRRLQTASCAARAFALDLGVDLYAPAQVNSAEALARIRAWRPDIGVVVAYGQILRPELLAVPPLGFINMHTSLLPKYRGAAPIQWAVANGERKTGVTIMQMDAGMDTGDILAWHEVAIGDADTAGAVSDRLTVAGTALLVETLSDLRAGRAVRHPQEQALATLAPKLTKAHGRIDWTQPARTLYNRVRGFYPWPCCSSDFGCSGRLRTLRILAAHVECGGTRVAPGTVMDVSGGGPLVACGEGALRLLQVQPEGGNVMTGTAFLCGRPVRVGDRFET